MLFIYKTAKLFTFLGAGFPSFFFYSRRQMQFFDNLYNRVSSVTLPQIAGLTLLAIPSYLIYKEHLEGKHILSKKSKRSKTQKPEEEVILSEKLKSETVRAGPAFLDSHVYHTRRLDRVKTAYNAVWTAVNEALNSGHQTFTVPLQEDDKRIQNVIKDILVEELGTDGYESSVSIQQTQDGTVIQVQVQ